MSYDLVFWTDHRTDRPEPSEIYQALLAGQPVRGLDPFDARQALAGLAPHFPGLTPTGDATGYLAWEAPDASVVFEFSWSPQHLLATARGRYTNEQMNEIIESAITSGGGRLFDPQTGERFDSE